MENETPKGKNMREMTRDGGEYCEWIANSNFKMERP